MKLLGAKLAMAAMSVMLIFACTKSDLEGGPGGGDNGEEVAVIIQAGIGSEKNTRAHDAVWDENDAIGLAMLDNGGTEVINDVYNYHYETGQQRGVFQPASSDMMVHFPSDGEIVSFRGYYPYYAGLGTSMEIPVNVSNQNILPDIDLMSAELATGYSKRNPIVRLYFHHRLTKLIFRFTNENQEDFGDLEDCVVTIRGMKTTGTFHLIEESLDVNASSGEDITFPLHSDVGVDERYGIVLPRAAGDGVEFEFKFPKGTYTARMADNLELMGGYKYTFYIELQEIPAVITAEIEDWLEGPETSYEWIQPNTQVGENENIDPGTVMDVFVSGNNIDYSELGTFTYGTDDKWTSTEPVYWESIPYNPAFMRASIVMEEPLNDDQTGDWLTSGVAEEVARNSGVHFSLNRAVSKTFVELRSDQFTADDLSSATVTLLDFEKGGYLENGEFVPGTERGDILMTDDAETGFRVALFQPQSVNSGAEVLRVNINGRSYTVEADKGALDFEAGYASKIIVTLNKNGLSVSVTVVDWKPGDVYTLETVQLGTVAGESHDVNVGDVIELYLLEGTGYTYQTSYTYGSDGTWTSGSPIYWEDMADGTNYFIARMDVADALDGTQLPDVLLSEPTRAYAFQPIDFELYHAAAKAVVTLVSDTFTDAQLNAATITLPGYKTGGSFEGATLVSGTGTGTINVDSDGNGNNIAIFEDQTIDAGQTVVDVNINGTTYSAVSDDENVVFKPGYATVLVVHLNKNGVALSVQVNDWLDDEYNLEVLGLNVVADDTEGVNAGETMNVYTGTDRDLLATYTYDGSQWNGPTIYWEDLDDPTTFYASILRQPAYDPATMPDDYLLSGPVTVGYGNAVNFTLSHAVAQVAVQLKSTDGSFTEEELDAMSVTLPGYATGGTYDDGVFVPGQGTGDINIVEVDGSGLAFVQPQTISSGRTVATVSTSTREYPVTYSQEVLYRAGYTTVLEIDIQKTKIAVSARVVDWETAQAITLVAQGITIAGGLEGTDEFFNGKTIHVYNMTESKVYPYSYLDGVWSGGQLYWDNYVNSGLTLGAVYYPANFTPAPAGSTSFAVNIPASQANGWDRNDLLMDYISYNAGVFRNFNFNFEHVLSRIRVELTTNDFPAGQLTGATVTLNGFELNGTASLTASQVTSTGAKTNNLTPYTTTDGRQYDAVVMPQTIPANTSFVSVKLPGYDTVFTGSLNNALVFEPGVITVVKVEVTGTRIQLSARLEEWDENDGGTIIIQ